VALFQKSDGGRNGGGRRQGARTRISTALLTAFAEDFEKYGEETVRITRVEKPIEYLRIAASLLPKEFEFTDNRLGELSDEELDAVIAYARQRLTIKRELTIDVGSREEPALNGEPARLLQTVSEAS
jgi:hypothetical protein